MNIEKLKLQFYKETDSLLGGTFKDHVRDALWTWIEDKLSHQVQAGVMQKPAGKWISVNDKFPPKDLMGEWVLVCYEPMGCGDLIINMGRYDGKWWIDGKTPIEKWEMEYWMPLPEPPES